MTDAGDGSYFDSLTVGDTWTTAGRTITGADVANFAGVSGDFNPIHTDATAAADSTFGERVAHGALVFAVMTGLIWQSRSPAERDAVIAFYGVDRLRFVAPVFVGDTIRVELAVAEKDEREHPDARGLVRYEATVRNDEDDAVLSCELLTLLE